MFKEHDIITHDGIEINVKLLDEKDREYVILSDSDIFFEIFGFNSFKLKLGDTVMENAIIGQVVQYNQPKALETIELSKQVM